MPLAAEANSGIGFLIQAAPAIGFALPFAIFIEAPVLARGLRLPFRQALGLSAVANLVSTVVGFFLAIALDIALLGSFSSSGAPFGRGIVLAALLPMFFVTWWVEAWFIRRRLKDASLRVGRTTLAANVLTYTLMVVAVWVFAPPYRGTLREQVTGVIHEMLAARTDIAVEYQTQGRFGPPRPVKSANPLLKGLRVEADGVVIADFADGEVQEFAGKSISMRPRVGAKGEIVEWQCTSSIAAKHLPANCR